MADEDEAGDAQAGLTFNNDGSFMEQFMKMQKEKEKSREDAESTKKDSPSLAAVKPVRKPPASLAQKMMKNRAAKKKLAVASAGKEGGAESKKESGVLKHASEHTLRKENTCAVHIMLKNPYIHTLLVEVHMGC